MTDQPTNAADATRPQRLAFAGTPEFARVALAALHAAGHPIALVLTQPDRPAGRGMALQPSVVKQWALAHGVPLAQPRSLRLDGRYPDEAATARQTLIDCGAQALVVAAYGLILPQWVMDHFEQTPGGLGCLNIHASLLPRWRGAAPIHRAIEAGDPQSGVTIMQMDAGLDTGPMLHVVPEPVHADDTTQSLHDRLAVVGAQAMMDVLARARHGTLKANAQPATGVTYAAKIDKAEAAIDWTCDAATLARRCRAFHPQPGLHTTAPGGAGLLKVWRCEIDSTYRPFLEPCGRILYIDATGITVQCGQGTALRLTELQRPGGKRLDAATFVVGCGWQTGDRLGAPAPDEGR
jgi:methionyl-tRNA formyltransferase